MELSAPTDGWRHHYFFVAFGMYMSVWAVVARWVANEVVLLTLYQVWVSFESKKINDSSIYGYVRLHTLKKEAHITQNELYLRQYEEKTKQLRENEDSQWRIALLSLACIVLIGIDHYVLPALGYPSVCIALSTGYPAAWNYVAPGLALPLIVFWLFPLFRDNRQDDWVYCPTLFRKLEEEKDKASRQLGY